MVLEEFLEVLEEVLEQVLEHAFFSLMDVAVATAAYLTFPGEKARRVAVSYRKNTSLQPHKLRLCMLLVGSSTSLAPRGEGGAAEDLV